MCGLWTIKIVVPMIARLTLQFQNVVVDVIMEHKCKRQQSGKYNVIRAKVICSV